MAKVYDETEKKDQIMNWLNGNGKWELGESDFDKIRLDYRKNLLITLNKYVNNDKDKTDDSTPENQILCSIIGDNIGLLVGVLTNYEQENFMNKYFIKIKNVNKINKLIEFQISIDTAKNILGNFQNEIPQNAFEIALERPDENFINDAVNHLKEFNFCNVEKRDVIQVEIEEKLYPAKCIAQIAYALANGINDSYIIPYHTSVSGKFAFESIFTKFNFDVKKPNSLENSKEENMEPTVIADILRSTHQIILQGPPGTGKTRVAKQIANVLIENTTLVKGEISTQIHSDNKKQIQLIQFHPAYSYEDFVRGIVAKSGENSQIKYVVENKILAAMAKSALDDKDKDNKSYVLIIDEINRANLSSVLGELIYALEYRDEAVESMYELEEKNADGNVIVKSREIILPKNLYIIGTMNTADRSVGSMDYALRRRFTFIDVLPNSNVANKKSKFSDIAKLFDEKDGFVSPEFNAKDVQLGHSYFMGKDTAELERKFKYQVLPILEEYVKDGVLIDKGGNQISAVIKALEDKKQIVSDAEDYDDEDEKAEESQS